MADSGIDNDTTVILYGDYYNLFATWAFWEMKVYGHTEAPVPEVGAFKLL